MVSLKIRINMSRENKEGQYPLVLQVIKHRCKREIYTPARDEIRAPVANV